MVLGSRRSRPRGNDGVMSGQSALPRACWRSLDRSQTLFGRGAFYAMLRARQLCEQGWNHVAVADDHDGAAGGGVVFVGVVDSQSMIEAGGDVVR